MFQRSLPERLDASEQALREARSKAGETALNRVLRRETRWIKPVRVLCDEHTTIGERGMALAELRTILKEMDEKGE